MNKFKFKDKLLYNQRFEWVDKLLNIDSFTDEEIKYSHIYRVLKMLHLSPDVCKRMMLQDYKCSNSGLIDKVIKITNGLNLTELQTDSPFVDIYCTYHIDTMIDAEEDLVLSQNKDGSNKKYIKLKELRYYYFRLNKRVFSSGGYNTETARPYFLSPGFKKEYRKQTNRNLNSHKIAHFNKILNKYNLIKIYQIKKKRNLYVLGKMNPCYWFEGVMEEKDLETIDKLIRDNGYQPVSLTPKDKEIQSLELTNKNHKEEIKTLKMDMENLRRNIEKADSTSDDSVFLIERNNELLGENQQLTQQLNRFGEWNIARKPVRKFNFEERFKEIMNPDSSRKTEMPPASEVYSEEEGDHLGKMREIISSFGVSRN